ncbi:MAG TPA: MFS transporter [Nostocaceae cyanobacterium]|nr:MFS transporter [Nostocaceae cyanobacterium]
MGVFLLIWLGQLIYMISSSMTGFALDISVFQRTGSATQFALLTISCSLPLIIISPFAGALVDRWDRRWTMIFCHCSTAICTLTLLTLLTVDHVEIWQIYLRNALTSIIGAFHGPAYKASITSLVPKDDLTRASGMVQLGMGIQQIIAPLLAGFLLLVIQIRGILLIDAISLVAALTPLLLIRFASHNQLQPTDSQSSSLWQDTLYGWQYLQQMPGLLSLLVLYTLYQFLIGFVGVLSYPLILCVTDASNVGKIVFVSGVGMIISATLISSVRNHWKNLSEALLIAICLSGIWICLAGFRPSVLEMAIANLLFFVTAPFISSTVQVIFQKKVLPSVQGRVFALMGAISSTAVPIAAGIAGPLADHVFEPLMSFDGPWSTQLIGQILGSGPGRGIGLLFVLVGCCLSFTGIIAYQYSPIRQLEETYPTLESTNQLNPVTK